MPTIRLTPQDDGGVRLADGRGSEAYLPQYRIRAWVKLGTDHRIRQAVLDTGAPAALFSRVVWEPLAGQGEIEWVCHPPGTTARANLPRVVVHGGRYPFRLGRVIVRPVDVDPKAGELSAAPVFVQCLEDDREAPTDPEPLPRLLVLGLAGFLNGRTLTVAASADGATWAATLAG